MGPKKKSQKKFERKHLSGEIVRRKHAKVAAQRRRAKEMRLAASMKDDEKGEESDEEGAEGEGAAPAAGKKRLEDMSIDEFLNVGIVDGGDDSGDEDGEEDGEEGESDSDDDIPAEDEDEEEWPEGEGESDEDEEDSEDDDDDEDDDSEDDATENGDPDALAGVKKSNRLLRSEIEEHQKELESLKDTDPEFYKFLQTEDSGLLDFDESEGEESEEDEDEDEDGDKKKDKGSFSDAKTLTTATVAKLCERAAGGEALGAARNLFRAYRAAAHYGDEDADEEAGVKLASSAAFHTLVTFTLEEADTILRGLLGQPQAGHPDEARLFKPHQQSRWKKVEPLAKSFLGNTLHLLGQLTDADMSRFLLARLNACVPFMHTFERLTKKILKAVLSLFGSGEPALRVQSILLIRNMAAVLPPPTLEKAAKGVYRQFAANAKFINATSVEHVLFMNTCVSEIYGLDQQQSYPLAFTYIRQLASLLLRGALTNKSKEAFRAVYCWQYINCLECWVRVLQSHANDESAPLRPLVYPVAQVALGAARLLPSARYAPLRLRLIRVLNALSASTGHFVPVAPLLLELLGFSELNKAPVSSKTRPPDFSLVLRVAKQELRSPAVQEVIVEGALQLLAEHLNQWAYSPGFPELAHIPCRDLRRFCKATQVTRFRKCARSVVDAAERNSDWISRKRDNVDFAPKDAERVRSFLSTEREGKKAPMEKLAAQLLDKERQRAAAHAATDVKITSGGRGSDGTSDDDEENDDEYDEDQMANGGGDEDSDDEDDDDEDEDSEDEDDEFDGMDDEDVLAALASRAGAAGGTGSGLQVRPKLPPKRNAADDGDVDVVEELVFSDDEEEEKPKNKKKKRF